MTSRLALIKALVVTVVFAIPAVIIAVGASTIPWSLYGLYALLLVHTFFSVRCFSMIIDPRDRFQWGIDGILVLSYILLAWSLPESRVFFVGWIALFALATIKYVALLGGLPNVRLLQRKILADVGGLALGVVGYVLAHASPSGIWLLFLGMLLATVYYLFINPLYRA